MTFDWELLAFMGKVALIAIVLLAIVVYVAGKNAASDAKAADEADA